MNADSKLSGDVFLELTSCIEADMLTVVASPEQATDVTLKNSLRILEFWGIARESWFCMRPGLWETDRSLSTSVRSVAKKDTLYSNIFPWESQLTQTSTLNHFPFEQVTGRTLPWKKKSKTWRTFIVSGIYRRALSLYNLTLNATWRLVSCLQHFNLSI